ncbi:MAG TPA: nucleotide sugar dehydrogenase [Candidatus Altiarchaeales archaeon]|nr:nucleotide sugar dehydrogenase [Candidatus Altiarchaeales archaeon]
MKACVVGLGRAGLPLAAVMAESGIEVVGFDIDEKKVAQINSGENPIGEEPGLEVLVKKHAGQNLKAVSNIGGAKDCTAYVVIVPLFLDGEFKPDFSILDDAFTKVASVLKEGDLVVLETTVPPGTTENRVCKILESESGLTAGADFHLACSPERIMTGYSISRFSEFPKIVGGLTRECTEAVFKFYSIFSKPKTVSDTTTAELVKVAEGVYRDVNIAVANELYTVSNELGVDFFEVREAARHKYCDLHEPGVVGGHCIPVYSRFLMNEHEVPLTKTARLLNDDMAQYYAKKMMQITASGKVAVVGLSYRPGVRETRHTQSHLLIRALRKEGFEVYGRDPIFTPVETEKYFNVPYAENLAEMNGILLSHGIPGLRMQLRELSSRILDVKNFLD